MGNKPRQKTGGGASDEDSAKPGDSSTDSGSEMELGPTGARRLVGEPASEELARAVDLIDRGNNRAARKLLEAIEDDDKVVSEQRDTLLAAIKPDPFALGVVLLALIVSVTAAILAFNR